MFSVIIFVCSYINFVVCVQYNSALAQNVWSQRCEKGSRVLNDCNWCVCNSRHKYSCTSRVCEEVDMFGHFNDAIKELHVGMEGHGAWRSTASSCEPGVHYRRGHLLCVCSEDGIWPNPICRDTFRVLHPVEIFNDKPLYQTCFPQKLYLVNCNVCLCPSTGKLDPEYCTKEKCVKEPTFKEADDVDVTEVYAQCDVDKKYKLGCKFCECLRNNRLVCDNCTSSICDGKKQGETFDVGCNVCYCGDDGLYCTNNTCNKGNNIIKSKTTIEKNLEECSGKIYENNCNLCYCYKKDGVKKIICSMNQCPNTISEDCITGSTYKKDCLKCKCVTKKGYKFQICEEDPNCPVKYSSNKNCDPFNIYKKDCNTCLCLADGRTLKCTTDNCGVEDTVSVNIIPVVQEVLRCPNGHSYKIDCNYCFCLDNGNALCTTMEC